jgi:hypothetical protein
LPCPCWRSSWFHVVSWEVRTLGSKKKITSVWLMLLGSNLNWWAAYFEGAWNSWVFIGCGYNTTVILPGTRRAPELVRERHICGKDTPCHSRLRTFPKHVQVDEAESEPMYTT